MVYWFYKSAHYKLVLEIGLFNSQHWDCIGISDSLCSESVGIREFKCFK